MRISGFVKKAGMIALALVAIGAACYGLFRISKSRTFQFFGGLNNRIDTTEKVVALTFDDAPTAHTEEVLDTLAQKQAKATFYVIGQELEGKKDLLDQIRDASRKGAVTLVYGARDTEHNEAVVLEGYLRRRK